MRFILPIKPLSINTAFQGRRFKTKECVEYCRTLGHLIPAQKKISGYVQIHYLFFLKNWKMTDGDNLVKILTDCIVQKRLIEDDRKIMRYVIDKLPAKIDSIEIEIEGFEDLKRTTEHGKD